MNYRELSTILGVSPATISLVVNNKPGVSEKTRAEVISQLKARGLYTPSNKTGPIIDIENIAFVVFKKDGCILDDHPFFLLLMQDLANISFANTFKVLILHVDKRLDLTHQLDALKALDVSGLIIFATEMEDADLKYFESIKSPIVYIDNDFSTFNVNTVAIDNTMGTYQAMSHLKSLGHKHICCIKSTNVISSFKEREEGFKKAAIALGFEKFDITEARFSEEGSYVDFMGYLKNTPKSKMPTAFVADDDIIIAGALRAFKECGYNVPRDVSLIGFSDRPVCCMTEPNLSTISVDRFGLTSEALSSLEDLVREGDLRLYTCKKRISTTFVARGSTGKAAKRD